jgi:hypothetical protein
MSCLAYDFSLLHARCQVKYVQPFYKLKAQKYEYKRGADGKFPPWPVDWMSRRMTPVLNGRNGYWAGDATHNSIMFSFTLNKDGSIPKKVQSQLLSAITRLEGNDPIDARMESAESSAAED